MKPKDTKRAIDQLIFDIKENEWYCEQGDSESQMEDWEKKLSNVRGLRNVSWCRTGMWRSVTQRVESHI